jgi:alpha/beta hydrolase fold
VEDCYAGLAWLATHAGELGVDVGRIALMGDSGSGGLAAGAALLARERGPAVAKQILIYPSGRPWCGGWASLGRIHADILTPVDMSAAALRPSPPSAHAESGCKLPVFCS